LGQTAAQQALGEGAYSTALISPSALKAGRIYHQDKQGNFHEICQDDFKDQNALQAMRVVTDDPSPDVLRDWTVLDGATFGFLGTNLRVPYRHLQVTGFQVSRVAEGNPYSFILGNLGPNCPSQILPRNKPYYVTSAVAVANRAQIFARGPIDSADLGPIRYRTPPQETPVTTRTNVVFGILAQRVD
jgi:hypothetical protein